MVQCTFDELTVLDVCPWCSGPRRAPGGAEKRSTNARTMDCWMIYGRMPNLGKEHGQGHS